MTTLNTSYHLLYKQALIDPTQLSEDDLLALLIKYPYSQPLIFSYERRKKLLHQESSNKDLALLYAHSESWLMHYVNKPILDIESKSTLSSTANSTAIVDKKVEQEEVPAEGQIAHTEAIYQNDSIEEVSYTANNNQTTEDSTVEDDASGNAEEIELENNNQEIVLEHEEAIELDKLVHQGSIGSNYFIFDAHEQVSESDESEIKKLEEKEDLSLYNDDLMPYSFRWWLHKTRLEYADTYQPYASNTITLAQTKSAINVGIIEESILDQQIKENIIHFQNPEEKLSEEVKKKPVIPVPPKKGDDIIQKFIQKDPIIQPPSPENINNENMARQSAEDNYFLVTETLANIYIDQGLYLKASEVFKKLILKYPEKKSYFATRIEDLEKNL